MKPPSVVHLADYGAGYAGNFVASLRSLERPCAELGLRVVFAFSELAGGRPWVDALRADGIPVHLLPAAGPLKARATAVARIAQAENAAVLHAHFAAYDVPAVAALPWLAGRARPRVLWHLHSSFPVEKPLAWRTKSFVKMRLLGRVAWAAAVSEALLSEAVDGGFPRERARYIPNAVDVRRAGATRLGRVGMRAALDIPERARVLLLLGWEPLRKGVDLALAAMPGLSRRHPGVMLLAVGTDDLRRFVAERLKGAVPPWLRIAEPQECIGDLFAAADLFVSASRREGFPYAVGEALAGALPVVSSDIPGLEWARDIAAVRLFASGDAGALERAAGEMMAWSPEQRAALGQRARETVARDLSLSRWATQVTHFYRAMLEGAAR